MTVDYYRRFIKHLRDGESLPFEFLDSRVDGSSLIHTIRTITVKTDYPYERLYIAKIFCNNCKYIPRCYFNVLEKLQQR